MLSCAICANPAHCANFGVVSCWACKMFFKRTMQSDIKYVCKRDNQCAEISPSRARSNYCRACRLKRCVTVGMKLNFSSLLEVKNKRDDHFAAVIESLLYQDSRRERVFITNFTRDNPTLEEVVKNRKLTITLRDPNYKMESRDWCFIGVYSTVKFLMSLHFVKDIGFEDKMVLLESYSTRANLLFRAIRSMRAKSDKVMEMDGNDFFEEFLSKCSHFSLPFTNHARTLLVNKLINLKITSEEFILITVLFFCNSNVHSLSERTKSILDDNQRKYSSVLLQYCLLTYQQTGPSRFSDLLSVCHVVNQNFADVLSLYILLQLHFHVEYKKLVENVLFGRITHE